jgi:serine/threonine-protein kinase
MGRLRTERIGSHFAGYRIDALIGQGGMGEVYRAENPRLGTWLALKVLAQHLADKEQVRERFVRESRAAASLDHPHVIPIFDADEADGIPFIAMRYVEGSDLRAVMEQEGPLAVDRSLDVLGQIADALDWAHSRGLVHRDVKPANILLERRPQGKEHAYLSDFGVAKQAFATGLTSTGDFVGTIEYIAPEQIQGTDVDGRADIYALGCILYECLSGTPPYDRDSAIGVMYAKLEQEPPALTEKRADLAPAVDQVILRALAKDPGDRYRTGTELIADARRAVAGEQISAPPAGPTETVVRPTPQAQETVVRPKPMAQETVVRPQAKPSPAAKSETVLAARDRPRRGKRISRRIVLLAAALLGIAAIAAGGAYALFGGSDSAAPGPTLPVTPPPANPSPQPPQPPPPPPRCRVGNVKGLTLVDARRRLRSSHCAVGPLARAYSASVPRNRVLAQSPGVGIRLKNRGKVAIVLSDGPRPVAPPKPHGDPPPTGDNPAPPPPPCPAGRCPQPPPPSPGRCPANRCPGG